MPGISVQRRPEMVYALACMAAIEGSAGNLTAPSGMGGMYALDAIAIAVIVGISMLGMRAATLAGQERTGVKIPGIQDTIRNTPGGERQCVAIARPATFGIKLTIVNTPTAAPGVQGTARVETIARTAKEQGEPPILISHIMLDLCDRIVVFRRGRICANLHKEQTDGQDVVACSTGARAQDTCAGAAWSANTATLRR